MLNSIKSTKQLTKCAESEKEQVTASKTQQTNRAATCNTANTWPHDTTVIHAVRLIQVISIVEKLGNLAEWEYLYMLSCTPIDLTEYCNEHDLEACALKFKILNNVLCILCIYRPPAGNFETFIYLNPYLINYTQIP